MGQKFDFNYNPFNREDISEMSSDDLQKNIIKFKRMIKEARTMGQDTTKFEVEFCYLDHERQMRQRTERAVRAYRKGERQ